MEKKNLQALAMKVECPRCKKTWTVSQLGIDSVDCTCHLFCQDGTKPGDCSVTRVNFSGEVGWPKGLHNDSEDESDDIMNITYYCSTHDEYYYKTPILIECDWTRWFSKRAPKKLRMSQGNY